MATYQTGERFQLILFDLDFTLDVESIPATLDASAGNGFHPVQFWRWENVLYVLTRKDTEHGTPTPVDR